MMDLSERGCEHLQCGETATRITIRLPHRADVHDRGRVARYCEMHAYRYQNLARADGATVTTLEWRYAP